MTRFQDGTSNTIVFTERYGTCGSSGNPNSTTTYCNLWSDSNLTWRPVFCVNNTNQQPTASGWTVCNLFQVQPDWINGCDSTPGHNPDAWWRHQCVCLGDASVRLRWRRASVRPPGPRPAIRATACRWLPTGIRVVGSRTARQRLDLRRIRRWRRPANKATHGKKKNTRRPPPGVFVLGKSWCQGKFDPTGSPGPFWEDASVSSSPAERTGETNLRADLKKKQKVGKTG